ncbi:unnamed protein product [Spirodela intermedia]|uniref:MINDY deubiquitinase domain-containing protein n=1 Tax=Spirodela intermedia TaxID=51605 RepID=A0A7I8IIA3_SPIIN|nr:unnamed protein product [Spirodela intermedia]CAA6657087.1 unnamed protein product [Spirodela intermedia]
MSEAERKATPEEDERQIGKDVGGDVSVGGEAETVDDEEVTAIFYKTKVVEFLGRSSQIILQNDNGPCPLLAICNVLLLRNVIDLSLDISEVSQQKLLSLVAERLLDSNSNLERNISDAIDLLPCLARGIDVNVLFRKYVPKEIYSECAIFDLLDIGLYHGWIVDPQDVETANAIGSKSYNALVGELVALDTRSPKEDKYLPEDDSVDFAAAATAALGVPSHVFQENRKRDLEEEEELMRVLKLSRGEQSISVTHSVISDTNSSDATASSGKTSSPMMLYLMLFLKQQIFYLNPLETDDSSSDHAYESLVNGSMEDGSISQKRMLKKSTLHDLENVNNCSEHGSELLTHQASPVSDLYCSPGGKDANESFSLNPNDIEPLYEGEECILGSAISDYKNREPVYEGEMVLAEHAEQDEGFISARSEYAASKQQCRAFNKELLKDNASQLTVYGLFCLQEGLKERELCVFFRNNHFSTMFKYNEELYLLATDQGYISQQNLVWEKLNEVNGDTMFMRSDFKQFMPEVQVNHSWDEQNGMNLGVTKQEFEKQPQRQQTPKVQQSSVSGGSRLIIGPQSSRHSSNASQRPDSKSKEKCIVM